MLFYDVECYNYKLHNTLRLLKHCSYQAVKVAICFSTGRGVYFEGWKIFFIWWPWDTNWRLPDKKQSMYFIIYVYILKNNVYVLSGDCEILTYIVIGQSGWQFSDNGNWLPVVTTKLKHAIHNGPESANTYWTWPRALISCWLPNHWAMMPRRPIWLHPNWFELGS